MIITPLCGSTIFYLGSKKRWQVSLGAYYSKAKNLKGESESHNTRDFQVNSGSFEGRYFYHLRQDGGMDGFSWMPYLASIEDHDWGLVTSIGYVIPIRHHAVLFQLQDNLGLTNINKNNPYDLEERNHSILLTFSYIFKFPPNPSHLWKNNSHWFACYYRVVICMLRPLPKLLHRSSLVRFVQFPSRIMR